MDTEGQELGPYEPVPDVLALAAIERAICHGPKTVWIVRAGEHLGFRSSPHTTRRLREHLERLRAEHGWVASKELLGREYWWLTPAGARHLEKVREEGRVGKLPESPQHRAWRQGRLAAAERIDGFRALLNSTLEDADAAAGTTVPTPSNTWFVLSTRLAAAFWLVGSAIYCVDEWAEPDDAQLDIDTDPGPPPGRRALVAWNKQEAQARGDQP